MPASSVDLFSSSKSSSSERTSCCCCCESEWMNWKMARTDLRMIPKSSSLVACGEKGSDLIKDTLQRDRKRRKIQHLAGIELMTSRVLLRRRMLYRCATTANLKDEINVQEAPLIWKEGCGGGSSSFFPTLRSRVRREV